MISSNRPTRLGVLPLMLLGTWLGAVGCAGPQVYVPLEQPSQLSAVVRWQAVQDLAEREQPSGRAHAANALIELTL